MIATSAMDESVERFGRAYGGCSIIWNPNIIGKIIKVDINNNHLCGVQIILNGMLFVMLNAYMLCDRHIEDPEYVGVMNMIQQLIQSLNPTFIIYGGGDFNTDTSRATPHMYGLLQCIQDCAFTLCIDLPIADVPYTYINNYTGNKSRIDHFFVSDVLTREQQVSKQLGLIANLTSLAAW